MTLIRVLHDRTFPESVILLQPLQNGWKPFKVQDLCRTCANASFSKLAFAETINEWVRER